MSKHPSSTDGAVPLEAPPEASDAPVVSAKIVIGPRRSDPAPASAPAPTVSASASKAAPAAAPRIATSAATGRSAGKGDGAVVAPVEVRVSGRVELNAPYEVLGTADESVRNVFPPERIVAGRYIIEERLGEGGMGRIYKVRHRDLGKLFALKIIHKSLAQQPHIRDAFYREAKMAASMSHPNVVSVLDFGVDNVHGAFIVMEYLIGETLAERMSRDFFVETKAACDIVIQVAEALHFIHSLGVVHCDIKPENIFICKETPAPAQDSHEGGRRSLIKLLDFGLASQPAVDAKEIVAATTVAGTPTYLAPERIRAKPPTPASDIYALAVLFYECLTGRAPFEGRLQDVLYGHLRTAPTPPSRLLGGYRPPPPANLDHLIVKSLAKDPESRPRTAGEFAFELRKVMSELGMVRGYDDVVLSSARADLCEALVDGSPLPMFVVSPTGEILFGNGAFSALIGIPEADLRGKLSSTLLGRICPRIDRDVRQVLQKSRTSRHTLVVHNESGEARGGWLTLSPYRREGEVVGVSGVVALMGDGDSA